MLIHAAWETGWTGRFGQFPELWHYQHWWGSVECIPRWIAGMKGWRLGRWGVEVALCAGEKFGCTAFAVSDGVGGWPAYIHAQSVTKRSPSKFFPFFSSEPWNRSDGIADTLGACHRRAISSVTIHIFKLHCSAYQHLHWQCNQEQCRIIMCFWAWKMF